MAYSKHYTRGRRARPLSDWMDFVSGAPLPPPAVSPSTPPVTTSTSSSASGTSFWDKLGTAVQGALSQQPMMVAPGVPLVAQPAGMSPTTQIALIGGGVLLLVLLARRT